MIVPTTINQGFEKLRQNLEITELQETTVSRRQQTVREAVEQEMKVLEKSIECGTISA